ncbi:hypothetical protein ACLOJK_037849 [Asimina triloba]
MYIISQLRPRAASSPFLPSPSRARSPLPLSSLAVVACSPPSPRRRPLLHACSPFFPRRRRLLPASPRRRPLLVPSIPSPSSPAPPYRPLTVVPCPSLSSSFPSPLPAPFFLPPVSLLGVPTVPKRFHMANDMNAFWCIGSESVRCSVPRRQGLALPFLD